MNVSYLKEFGFLSRNAERFAQQLNLQQALQAAGGLTQWEQEARALTRSAVQSLPAPCLLLLHQLPLLLWFVAKCCFGNRCF